MFPFIPEVSNKADKIELSSLSAPPMSDSLITAAEKLEYNQVLRTKVDFKLMEQE